MIRGVVLVALAACGSSATEAEPDAGVEYPEPTGAVLVQDVHPGPFAGASSTITIAPTSAHSLLVVVVAAEGPVASITTSTGRRLQRDAGPFLTDGLCNRAYEVWSTGDVEAGVTSLELALPSPTAHVVDVLEVGGLSRFPLVNTRGLGTLTDMPQPLDDLSMRAVTGNLLISTMVTCAGTITLAPGSLFTAFPPHASSQVVYQIAPIDDTYNPEWVYDSGPISVSLLVYR